MGRWPPGNGDPFPVKATIDRMISIIEAQGRHLFARVDHAGHAPKKGLELPPAELILLGNPAIRTRLMQEHQVAAVDLPMKVLVWQDEHGHVRIAHNSMVWLKRRLRLTDEATLRTIDEILARVCAGVRTRP